MSAHFLALIAEGDKKREESVVVTPLGNGLYRCEAFGETFEVEKVIHQKGVTLKLGDDIYDLVFDAVSGSELVVSQGGDQRQIEVFDARGALARQLRLSHDQGASGAWELHAPMPGKVTALLVKPGESVKAGQALVVIEAMKMENELRAPAAGVIQTIAVQVGQTVEARALIITTSALEK